MYVVMGAIQANSVWNVARPSQQMQMDGNVHAGQLTRASSVQNVASKNQQVFPSTSVTNADGSLKICQNHQNSALNVEMYLMTGI